MSTKRIGAATVAIGMMVGAHASDHTYFWIKPTPTGKTIECQRVTTEDEMVSALESAGYPINNGIPDIDWQTHDAIIIAPKDSYSNGILSFRGLTLDSSSMRVRYGWFATSGGASISTGIGGGSSLAGYVDAASAGKHAALVVSYKANLVGGKTIFCTNHGFQ